MVLHKDYKRFLVTMSHVKPTTLRNLRAMLSRLPPPKSLTPKWLRDRMQEVSPQTVRNEKKLARRLLKWLELPTDELDKVRLPKVEGVTVEDLYSRKDLVAIFKATHNTRDRALLQVLYESAVRAAELLSMTFENTTFNEDGTAHIITTGKTGTRRIALYQSVPALKAWINTHPIGTGYIWVGIKTPFAPLSYTGLFQVAKRAAVRAGLKKKKACHMLRHTRLTELTNLGVRGEALRKFAGWTAGSSMEQTYIHLSDSDVHDEIRIKVFGLEPNGKHHEPLIEGRQCPHCQAKNDAVARICAECGRSLNGADSELDTMKSELRAMSAVIENLLEEVQIAKNPEEWKAFLEWSDTIKPKVKTKKAGK